MDEFESLSDVQSELLRRFQEVTNVQDVEIATATLASLDWDLQKAIDAQLSCNDAPMDGTDDDDIIVTNAIASSPTHMINGDHVLLDEDIFDDDEIEVLPRGGAPGSSRSSGNATSKHNGIAESGASSSRMSKKSDRTGQSGNLRSGSSTARTGISTLSQKEHSDSDSDDDIFHDADCFAQHDDIIDALQMPSRQEDRVPLVPSEFSSVEEAMHNFVTVFESRYGGNHPPFYQSHLQGAIREAFDAPGRPVAERRPLAVYLHNDRAVACNVFAENVLCSELVSSLLKGQFVTWPWDMTQKENRRKLFEWMELLGVRDMKNTLERLADERYPLLVVLVKDKGVIQPIDVAWGCDNSQQVVDKLMNGLDHYQQIKNTDAAEERERIEREEIRQEQAREYERSLAQDRARLEQMEKERNQQMEEEAQRLREVEEKARREEVLAASLPVEPPASETDVATMRVRFPNGLTEMRRFRMSEPLLNLTVFVESKGFSLKEHKIWNSDVPKKNVVESFDLSRSLADLNWPVREQVIVDEI